MREILFRGKQKDDGCWIYGSLQCFKGFSIFDEGYKNFFTVSHETIGQYTGIDDKNGMQIFEGDIVRGRDALEKDLVVEGYIDYQYGSFCIVGDLMTHFRWMDYEVEVIGNIHDNPYMIGGKEDCD